MIVGGVVGVVGVGGGVAGMNGVDGVDGVDSVLVLLDERWRSSSRAVGFPGSSHICLRGKSVKWVDWLYSTRKRSHGTWSLGRGSRG